MTGPRLQYTYIAFAALLLIFHFGLLLDSARIKSPTADEYTYISTAYLYTETGDFRVDRTHPPLIRLLIGLPLQTLDIEMPPLQREQWDDPASYELGYSLGWEMLLGKNDNDRQQILFWARLPVMLLSVALGALLFLWASQLYGPAPAAIALWFYAFSPNILAHARLATLDLGTAFFITLALFSLYHAAAKPSLIRWLLSGAALGLALAAKVTALLLIPVAGLALYLAFRHPHAQPKQMLRYALACGLSAFIALLLIYGFPLRPFYYPDTLANVFTKSLQGGTGGEAIPGMPHANHAFYLMGAFSTSGFAHYYFAAMAVKTPLAFLLAILLALRWFRRAWRPIADPLLLATIALLLTASVFNRVNIGLRHILPVYPLLFLYAARITEYASREAILPPRVTWQRLPLKPLLQVALAVSAALSILLYPHAALSVHPDYIPFFNAAAGGPTQGHRYLDDSNLDWGQDLGRLAQLQNEFPNQPLYVATDKMFIPPAFGVDAQRLRLEDIPNPPEGIIAVGKHWAIRQQARRHSPYYFDWLERYSPIAHIGHSIWVFRFPPP